MYFGDWISNFRGTYREVVRRLRMQTSSVPDINSEMMQFSSPVKQTLHSFIPAQCSVLPEHPLVRVQSTNFCLLVMTVPGKQKKTSVLWRDAGRSYPTNNWNCFGERETGWGFTVEAGHLGRAGETFAPINTLKHGAQRTGR